MLESEVPHFFPKMHLKVYGELFCIYASSLKAPGQDGIPIELIKAGEDATIKIITKICNSIWKTGKWPEDWKGSTFIPIFKKGDARSCDNYRTIALISHTSKILLKII